MNFSLLVILFVALPLLELFILFELAGFVGGLTAVAIVVLTGVVGASIARFQGLDVLWGIRNDMAEGRLPASRLIDGVMILVAGALLITPGLITDIAGFLLLFPPARARIKAWARKALEVRIAQGSVEFHPSD